MAKAKGSLGKAKTRQYDLPFQKDIGTRYMTTVITLMVFLGFLCAALGLTLHAINTRWTTGLEGKMTVEIPAQGIDQSLRERDALDAIAQSVIAEFQNHRFVRKIEVISQEAMTDMISPWLGERQNYADLPLPVLISVEVEGTLGEKDLLTLQNAVVSIDAASRLDTHKDWLAELLRFTGAIKLVALVMGIVITLTTLMAVAGVVRARLAAHMADVELLHLMGATDTYIARQFQGHILGLSLRGCLIGAGMGVLMIKGIGWVAGQLGFILMPDFAITMSSWVMLCLVPIAIIGLCFVTARATILNALKDMP